MPSKIQSDRRVIPSDRVFPISSFPEMHLIKILRWPFVVVEISKKANSIVN